MVILMINTLKISLVVILWLLDYISLNKQIWQVRTDLVPEKIFMNTGTIQFREIFYQILMAVMINSQILRRSVLFSAMQTKIRQQEDSIHEMEEQLDALTKEKEKVGPFNQLSWLSSISYYLSMFGLEMYIVSSLDQILYVNIFRLTTCLRPHRESWKRPARGWLRRPITWCVQQAPWRRRPRPWKRPSRRGRSRDIWSNITLTQRTVCMGRPQR